MMFLDTTPLGFSKHASGCAWRGKRFGVAVAAGRVLFKVFTLGTPGVAFASMKAVDGVRILIGLLEMPVGRFAIRVEIRLLLGSSKMPGAGPVAQTAAEVLDGGIMTGDDYGTQ